MAVEDRHDRYALIGAGPAGLAAARKLKMLDIPFDGYEVHSDVGGLWDIDNPRSTMYESAHLISSRTMTEFAEFPMGASVADYPRHDEMKAYFRDYARHFGLYDHYRFSTSVERVKKERDHWIVTLDSGEQLRYQGVLIANGTLSEPNVPRIPGRFAGEVLHSSAYRNPGIFADKRVLIVGAGNSGCDIAVDAVHRARSVAISVRRGYHFVPKYVFGVPADTIGGKVRLPARVKQRVDTALLKMFTGDPERYGFPAPDHRLYESHPIVNSLILYHAGHGDVAVRPDLERFAGSEVVFRDGTRGEFDLVLLATGYKLHFPFIDRRHLCLEASKPGFFLNAFHPQHDNLFILGMIEGAGIGWEGRAEQAELVARFIDACRRESPAAEWFREYKAGPEPDLTGGFHYLQVDRMAWYVHKESYRSEVRRCIRRFAET